MGDSFRGTKRRDPATKPDQNEPQRIRVLVADAQLLFAEALSAALRSVADFEVLDDHPTSGLGASELAIKHQPDVALLDFWMSDMNGPAAARAIQGWAPRVKVIILSWLHGPGQVGEAMTSGAVGFLPKSVPLYEVVDAIVRARAGESPVSAGAIESLVAEIAERGERNVSIGDRVFSLTPREVQILHLLNQGFAAKQVAGQLKITVGTVKNHIHKILSKTGTQTQAEVIAMARQTGLLRERSLPPHPPHPGPHWVT